MTTDAAARPAALPAAARRGPARGVRIALALALGGGLAIALAARIEPPRRAARDDLYTIPPGTAARVARGESVADVLPQHVTTAVGNQLIVVNRDVTDHAFGPFVLAPGQRWARQFAVSGDYAMDCTIYPDAGFTVSVTPGPTPAGGPTLWLHQALLAAWLVATAAVVGLQLAAAAALDGAPGEAALAARALTAARAARPSLVVLGALAAAALVTALARVVPWRAAASGTASIDAWFAVAWTAVAVAVLHRLTRPSRPASAWNLALWSLIVVWPATRLLAPAVSPTSMLLLLTGTGLLAAVVVGQLTAGRAIDAAAGAPATLAWLAAAGVALAIAGVPLPPSGIGPRLAAGVADLAAGVALVAALTRRPPRPNAAWLALGAAVAAGALGAFQLAMAAVGGVMGGGG